MRYLLSPSIPGEMPTQDSIKLEEMIRLSFLFQTRLQ